MYPAQDDCPIIQNNVINKRCEVDKCSTWVKTALSHLETCIPAPSTSPR